MASSKSDREPEPEPGAPPASLNGGQVLDGYFLKSRAAMLDIAAMLDRLSRGEQSGGAINDDRKRQLRAALAILNDAEGAKARRIQEIFSQ